MLQNVNNFSCFMELGFANCVLYSVICTIGNYVIF